MRKKRRKTRNLTKICESILDAIIAEPSDTTGNGRDNCTISKGSRARVCVCVCGRGMGECVSPTHPNVLRCARPAVIIEFLAPESDNGGYYSGSGSASY